MITKKPSSLNITAIKCLDFPNRTFLELFIELQY